MPRHVKSTLGKWRLAMRCFDPRQCSPLTRFVREDFLVFNCAALVGESLLREELREGCERFGVPDVFGAKRVRDVVDVLEESLDEVVAKQRREVNSDSAEAREKTIILDCNLLIAKTAIAMMYGILPKILDRDLSVFSQGMFHLESRTAVALKVFVTDPQLSWGTVLGVCDPVKLVAGGFTRLDLRELSRSA